MRHYKFTWSDRSGRITATATVCTGDDETGLAPRLCIVAARERAAALNARQGALAGHGSPVLLFNAPGAAVTAWTARPEHAERVMP